jgi:hypothetical protein
MLAGKFINNLEKGCQHILRRDARPAEGLLRLDYLRACAKILANE